MFFYNNTTEGDGNYHLVDIIAFEQICKLFIINFDLIFSMANT